VLEPYAPNIIRVSLSLLKDQAKARAWVRFVATPSAQGWTRQHSDQGEVYRSSRLLVTVVNDPPHKPMQTELDIAKFFTDSVPQAHIQGEHSPGQVSLGVDGLVDDRA